MTLKKYYLGDLALLAVVPPVVAVPVAGLLPVSISPPMGVLGVGVLGVAVLGIGVVGAVVVGGGVAGGVTVVSRMLVPVRAFSVVSSRLHPVPTAAAAR